MQEFFLKKKRHYKVGNNDDIIIKDCGKIKLQENEQISFIGNNGLYDFCRKDWGFYSTPSINKRLKNNNFEVYLVSNLFNDIYIWSVEKNKKKEFYKYLIKENHKILLRLDELRSNFEIANEMTNLIDELKNTCNGISDCRKEKRNIETIYEYNSPPKKEPKYQVKNYKRFIIRCNKCQHFFAEHKINTSLLYNKDYSTISHGKNVYKKFKKINRLGKKSDNFHRVKRILNFFKDVKGNKLSLLDIGSGLGIFLYNLRKKVKWELNGVEPDINFSNFSNNTLKIKTTNKSFKKNLFKKKKFDIITLNKVIEHVKDPEKFILTAMENLRKNGYIYLEVPDGVSAFKSKEGKNREEFFLDHLHVFSAKSLYNLIIKCGLKVISIKSIKEKSGKLTIFAFVKKW